MKNTSRRIGLAALAATGVTTGLVVATVIGPSGGPSTALTGHEAYDYAISHLQARHEARDAVYIDQNLQQLLPNQEYSVSGESAAPLVAGIQSGVITSIAPGAGYAVDGDADSGTVVDPFSDSALWRVVELTVSTDQSVGSVATRTMRVGLAMDAEADYESFKNGLIGQQVILPVEEQGFFRHDPSLFSIAHGGSLLGIIGQDNSLHFPVLDADEEETYAAGITTVPELFREASEDRAVLDVTITDGLPVIED